MKNTAYIFFLTLSILCISCTQKESAENSAPAATQTFSNAFYVRTAPVVTTSLTDVIHVTGMIQSDTEARPSFKIGGVVDGIFVKEGDRVRKGQLLGRLHMTEIEAQVTQARMALEKATRDQQRVENLYKDSIATMEQWQNTITAMDVAKKSLQIAEFNQTYAEIKSPIDGKVVLQYVHEGEIVGPGTPVFYIIGVQQNDWRLIAGLTDKNWGRVKVGNMVDISLDAYPASPLKGKVLRLSDVANPMSGTFDVEISLPANDKRIAAGLLAQLAIHPAQGKTYPVIPVEALVSSNGRDGIVFIPRNGKAEKRAVKIHEWNGESVSIYAGLEDVEEIITAGSGFLEDGDSIMVENEKPSEATSATLK